MRATDLAQTRGSPTSRGSTRCVNLDAVAEFPGYVYDNDDSAGQFLTTGLDFSAGSGFVDEWILEINAGDAHRRRPGGGGGGRKTSPFDDDPGGDQ